MRRNSHSSEKLMHSIKVCLAKSYVDNLSEETRKGMTEKALQSVYGKAALEFGDIKRGSCADR